MNPTINISVIIPTRNREEVLWKTIEKAVNAIKNHSAEIIVINDGDNDLIIPPDFLNKIRLHNNPSRGVSFARNFAASISNGSILFFIDDDMWINTNAVRWVNENANNKVNTVYNLNWNYPQELNEKLKQSKIGQYILSASYQTMWGRMHVKGIEPKTGLYPFKMIMSGSLVMTKSIFNKIGGYNEEMIFQGEDNDLANKINALQIPIFCVFDVKLHHNQKDRLQTDLYFKRVADGFNSQFKAIQAGLVAPWGRENYGTVSIFVFSIFVFTEKFWMAVLALTPAKGFSKINNKLIGKLSGLQRFKCWKRFNENLKN